MSAADLKGMVDGYRRLSTANVSDGLDRAGIDGAPQGIGPLWSGCGKIVGPAATLKLVPAGEAEESPVLGTLEAVKRGNPGDVLVIDQGGRTDVNSYGGVADFTTRQFGLVGTVIDGVTRDIDEYKTLNLPVYGRASSSARSATAAPAPATASPSSRATSSSPTRTGSASSRSRARPRC